MVYTRYLKRIGSKIIELPILIFQSTGCVSKGDTSGYFYNELMVVECITLYRKLNLLCTIVKQHQSLDC